MLKNTNESSSHSTAGHHQQHSFLSSSGTNKKRDIQILMLRHGERADEVAGYNTTTPRSRKECLDPPLTEEGHRQATEAFEQILPTLLGKRVAVFVSPLRRTMATAAMIGAAVSNSDKNKKHYCLADISFVVPQSWQTGTKDKEDDRPSLSFSSSNSAAPLSFCDKSNERSIPIVVMNGLSDCANNVLRVGGAFSAVKRGYIDGAAMEKNYLVDSSSLTYATPLMNMINKSIYIGNLSTCSIQFYKELKTYEQGGYYDGRIVPMSPHLGAEQHNITPSTDSTRMTTVKNNTITFDTKETAKTRSHSSSDIKLQRTETNEDHFKNTLNRIARLATEANCDVCIVVTHREGIRDTAREISGNKARFATPYCCIGKFIASVLLNNPKIVQWKFEDVVPYQQFSISIRDRFRHGDIAKKRKTVS